MFLKLLTMASHLNPPNWQSHVCNFSQLIRDIKHACLTRLLCMKVEIYQLPTLPTSLLRTSSPTSDGLLAPNGSFWMYISWPYLFLTWFFSYSLNSLYTWGHHQIIAYRIINSMYFLSCFNKSLTITCSISPLLLSSKLCLKRSYYFVSLNCLVL